MDDRGYVAQALFDRLSGDGMRFRVLGDSHGYPERAPPEVELAVARAALAEMPRALARYCQELDLQLVQLAPEDSRAWRCVLAWSDEVGRPRFMSVRLCSDYCRGLRCYLRAEELLPGTPEALFSHGLVDAVERQELSPERAAWLSSLWNDDPRGAIERIARFWPSSANIRLIAQAAKHGEWTPVRAGLASLRRALRRTVPPEPGDIAARLAVLARNLAQPARAAIGFMGRESSLRSAALGEVARDLAPLRLTLFEAGAHAPRADLRVVFDPPDEVKHRGDVIAIDGGRELSGLVLAIERAILRWLECRVERRYPGALVGENPMAARILQFVSRHRIPVLSKAVSAFLNCAIDCSLGSPVLMPYPFGIVIERGVSIGSRVTVMQQATIGRKHPSDPGVPVLEDNVYVGPGAAILGAVRIGRGATVGANAVVTRDVPSHCTVVGANRILGLDRRVVEKRRKDSPIVVNT
jgi:serine O-acetyltransferase